jgi:hypothetical protein
MNIAKRAKQQIKLKCKLEGTPITLTWQDASADPPAVDPTTGAGILADDPTAVIGSSRSCTTKAFVHFVQPIQSAYRKFAEIEAGDSIVDLVFDLYRVTDAGDTALEVDDVVDELTFNSANRAIADDADVAIGTLVEAHTLNALTVTFGGRKWVQKEIGEKLAANWDCCYSNVNLNRALLLRLQ